VRERERFRPAVLGVIAVGGAIGATARYGLGEALPVAAGRIPWTTFAINVSGAFVLGVLLTFVLERWPPTQYVRPFGAIGVLGAFTTFSTFSVESDVLIKDGHVATAIAYDVMSLVIGLGAAYLGIVVGRMWPPPERRPYPDYVEDAEDA
jgi:CrcB protein